jgi:hypothetical protein
MHRTVGGHQPRALAAAAAAAAGADAGRRRKLLRQGRQGPEALQQRRRARWSVASGRLACSAADGGELRLHAAVPHGVQHLLAPLQVLVVALLLLLLLPLLGRPFSGCTCRRGWLLLLCRRRRRRIALRAGAASVVGALRPCPPGSCGLRACSNCCRPIRCCPVCCRPVCPPGAVTRQPVVKVKHRARRALPPGGACRGLGGRLLLLVCRCCGCGLQCRPPPLGQLQLLPGLAAQQRLQQRRGAAHVAQRLARCRGQLAQAAGQRLGRLQRQRRQRLRLPQQRLQLLAHQRRQAVLLARLAARALLGARQPRLLPLATLRLQLQLLKLLQVLLVAPRL